MNRFQQVILINLFQLPSIIGKMKKMAGDENCTEEERYTYLRYVSKRMERTGRITTQVSGLENLPKEGGYIMYPNHQGRWDAFGIACAHEEPLTVVIDQTRAEFPFITEIIDLLKGQRLDKQDVRQGLKVIQQVAREVKEGRRYIIFPEGFYDRSKKNTLIEFKPGCFKASLKSQTPIVPMVLYDTYKAMDRCCVGRISVQIHFLEPILYETYKDMKTPQIADMVKGRIQNKLDELSGI